MEILTKKSITKARSRENEWILEFINIKERGLDYAYCRNDVEAIHKMEEDIKRLRIMYRKATL
ncbi:hypothetical protein LCGC14_0400240 [marine sediment metagenome]|uniref:Uncharacterized protein n=1 Tax=marine sediment metagenome TaxID=412755 RepID=A0A0F9T2J5_9ZZZZ